jgi:glycosyltransferase involved in cell wall biosynthesis
LKLTIITINLNNALGLRKTIESVVNQTSHEFEYIIIDGGSTDGSVDIIKSFTNIPPGIYTPITYTPEPMPSRFTGLHFVSHAPCPIVYWLSEPDSGIYSAMNKGILKAIGEYCQFLNSGDCLSAIDSTERMLNNLPECSIVFGNMQQMLNGNPVKWVGEKKTKHTFLDLYKGSMNHSSAYIKKSLFEKYGLYDESLKIVSDWKFYVLTVGLNNENIIHRDISVTLFDLNGISNTNQELEKAERRLVLEQMVPKTILEDYDAQWRNIDKANRINRYTITRSFFWFIDRVLAKMEKLQFKLNVK